MAILILASGQRAPQVLPSHFTVVQTFHHARQAAPSQPFEDDLDDEPDPDEAGVVRVRGIDIPERDHEARLLRELWGEWDSDEYRRER